MGNEAELPGPAQWTHKTLIKTMPDGPSEKDRRREDQTTGCRDEREGLQETQVTSRNLKGKEIDSAFRSFKENQTHEHLDLSSVKPICELLKPEV